MARDFLGSVEKAMNKHMLGRSWFLKHFVCCYHSFFYFLLLLVSTAPHQYSLFNEKVFCATFWKSYKTMSIEVSLDDRKRIVCKQMNERIRDKGSVHCVIISSSFKNIHDIKVKGSKAGMTLTIGNALSRKCVTVKGSSCGVTISSI